MKHTYKTTSKHLNTLLATCQVMSIKTHMYHRHVSWKEFMSLHQFFEQEYTSFFYRIDDVAERILAIDSKILMNVETLPQESLVPTASQLSTPTAILESYDKDLRALDTFLHTAVAEAWAEGDVVTQDFFIWILWDIEKKLWIVGAMQK